MVQKLPVEEALHRRVVGPQHHQNQHHRVHQHPVIRQAPHGPGFLLIRPEQQHGKPFQKSRFFLFFFVMAGSLLALVVIGTNLFGYSNSVAEAQKSYDLGDYESAFARLSGMEIKEADIEIYEKSRILAYASGEFRAYQSFFAPASSALSSLPALSSSVPFSPAVPAFCALWPPPLPLPSYFPLPSAFLFPAAAFEQLSGVPETEDAPGSLERADSGSGKI